MTHTRRLLLTGCSFLALASTGWAQEVTELDPIHVSLVDDGQENIESTGGMVIDQADIQALDPQNMSDLFSRESAVTVSGGAGPSKRIHVFGIEQSQLAVTVDGMPEVGSSWHHTGSTVIDPAFLKAVEVEAGAAAADAGFAAGAGAIRYETVDADDMLEDGQNIGGLVKLSYGTNGQGYNGTLGTYGRYKGADWLLVLHQQDGGDNYDAGNGDEILGTEPAASGILAKAGYEFDTHRVELSFQHDEDNADRTIKMNLGLEGDDELYPMEVISDRFSVTYTTIAPTELWDPEFQIYATEFTYDRPDYAVDSTNGDMYLKEEQLGGKFQNTFLVGPGNITAGVDFNDHDYHVDAYDDTPTRDFDTQQVGAYAQGRFEFANGIDISAGVRADFMEFTDWNDEEFSDSGTSANLTVSYEFVPGFEVFAGASQTWMGYDVGEYGYLHARDETFTTDSDFKATTADNVKVGFNAGRGPWQGGITYFETNIDNVSYYGYSSDTYMLYNAYDLRSVGYTINGSYAWDTGRVGVTYTDAHTTENGEEAAPDGGYITPVGETATLFVDQTFEQIGLTVGGTVEWAGSLNGDWGSQPKMDPYTVVNAYAEWTPEQLGDTTFRLAVENLFDETYAERSSYSYSEARGGIDPIYGAGLTVTAGVTIKF